MSHTHKTRRRITVCTLLLSSMSNNRVLRDKMFELAVKSLNNRVLRDKMFELAVKSLNDGSVSISEMQQSTYDVNNVTLRPRSHR